jgi:hypothetical protein
MVSSGLLRRVALVRADVLEEPSVSFIRVTRIGEVRTTLAAASNRRNSCHPDEGGARFLRNVLHTSRNLSTLKMEAARFSETSVPTRSTRRHIPEDGTLRGHRRGNLKSDFHSCSLLSLRLSKKYISNPTNSGSKGDGRCTPPVGLSAGLLNMYMSTLV